MYGHSQDGFLLCGGSDYYQNGRTVGLCGNCKLSITFLKSSFQFNNTIYTQNPFLSTGLVEGKHTCFNHSITKGWFRSEHVLRERRIGHVSWNVEPEGTILMGGVPEWDFFEMGLTKKYDAL